MSVGFVGIQPRGHCTTPGEKTSKESQGKQSGNSDWKSVWGTQWGNYLLLLECISEKQVSWRHLFMNKWAGWYHFPHHPFSINTDTHVQEALQCSYSLPNMLTPRPIHLCYSGELSFCIMLTPSLKRSVQTLPSSHLFTRVFFRASVPVKVVMSSFHEQTREHLVKPHHIQIRDQTQTRDPLQMTGLKG